MNLLRMILVLCVCTPLVRAEKLESPDGNIRLEVGFDSGRPFYRVHRNGEMMVDQSFLGIEGSTLDGKKFFDANNWRKLMVSHRQINTSWKPVVGKRSEVRDRCRQMTLHLQPQVNGLPKMNLVFRAYNEGIAFRYVLKPASDETQTIRITHDRSEFAFTGDHQAWSYRHENRPFGPDRISSLTGKEGIPS